MTVAIWQRLLVKLIFLLSLLFPAVALAETQVVPDARVVRYVVVRMGPSTQTAAIDALDPGESLTLVADLTGWYEVRLSDGRIGYVSKIWTEALVSAVGAYRVHVIDVGTGLSVFVEGPDFTLLYDAGSQDDNRTKTHDRVLAYIAKVHPGLTRIDHLVLSHAHKDHIALIPDMFEAFAVGHVWDSGRIYDSCGYRAFLLDVAAEAGVTYSTALGNAGPSDATFPGCDTLPHTVPFPASQRIIASAPVALGAGATMTFLHVDAEPYSDANENSLVVSLDLGGHRILLAGDAEGGERMSPASAPHPQSVEAKLLSCCRAALASEVLIVGHHGSKTSSRTAFLDAVGARSFIVSSGPFPYSGTRLPDQEVIDELGRRGALFRTDLNDAACRTKMDKIGADNDNKVGGCDNVVVDVDSAGARVSYNRIAD